MIDDRLRHAREMVILPQALIIAMDLGTTGNRVMAYNYHGEVQAKRYYEFQQYYPQPGWVEHDANEIKSGALRALKEVLQECEAHSILGLGITNQRETTVIWNRHSGEPIYRAIVWQCRRTESLCRSLQAHAPLFKAKTGLFLDPYFSGTKIKWLLDHVAGARKLAEQGDLLFGTIDTWLLWHLTGGTVHATEPSNASRTLLYNIQQHQFDQELLELLSIPAQLLPEVKASNSLFGITDEQVVGRAIPIHAILGDQQASLYAHSGTANGKVKNTYGTGLFVVTNTGSTLVASEQLVTTVACQLDHEINYALEGSIFMGGAIIQWLRDNLKVMTDASQSEMMALSLDNNQGVYLVPAFQGLGAPYWQTNARAMVVGLSRKADQAVLVRAALEAIAYQTKDVINAMTSSLGIELRELHVDGGACVNSFLMQFQADILGIPVMRPNQIETTSLGIARLLGQTVNFWSAQYFEQHVLVLDRTFKPQMKPEEQRRLYQAWQHAVHMTLEWARPTND